MDPLLLKYYERELHFIRDMGDEFAQEFPKEAEFLGLKSASIKDPYVERLYEGFAFLAARVQLRIDSEYPKFTENLFNVIYPQYLSPIPSMAIVQFQPSADAGYETGASIPRLTQLRGNRAVGDQTACQYRTSHEVKLWPIKIDQAEYTASVSQFGKLLSQTPSHDYSRPKAGLRLELQSLAGQPLNTVTAENLILHLAGHDAHVARLYEQMLGNRVAVLYKNDNSQDTWQLLAENDALTTVGFADDEALFPSDDRTFSGFRLLREYYAFPERYLFVRLHYMQAMLSRCEDSKLEILILFDRIDSELENRVEAKNFQLFCTPVINLFSKRVDRIHTKESKEEYHLIPDRTRPLDYEVFQVNELVGFGINSDETHHFKPLYEANGRQNHSGGYYTIRRQRRKLSESQRKRGGRTNYIGSECFVSLTNRNEMPSDIQTAQLGVEALCTNRDLPLRFPIGQGDSDFALDVSAPVDAIRCIKGPTRPLPSLAHESGQLAWRLINQLSLSHLSLNNHSDDRGAEFLRDLMSLYGDLSNASIRKQIDGVVSVKTQQITRRIPIPGPISFGRGLEIQVTVEENAFAGTGVFLMGAVLEQFFSRYVSLNSFTETVIRSQERGDVHRWPARIGQRQIS